MSGFDTFIERILKNEGGYVNHPADPGGATNWGITERVARKWGYAGHMRDLPRATAIDIYRQEYWAPVDALKLPYALQFQVLDANINHGLSRAVSLLQRAVGVEDDGVFGYVTKARVGEMAADSLALGVAFNVTRLRFYTNLGTFSSFGKGWSRRIADNLVYLLEDI